jgi:hypothetical protein
MILAGARDIYLLKKHGHLLWVAPSLLFDGYQSSFLQLKWLGHEIDPSLPSSAGYRMSGFILLICLYAFMALRGTTLAFLLLPLDAHSIGNHVSCNFRKCDLPFVIVLSFALV